jgi:hypothetical protein
MRAAKQDPAETGNRLLAALAVDERSRLLAESTLVHLKRRQILYSANDNIKFCYFPLSGMISVLSTTESGKSLILGIVGNEGFASAAALLQPPIAPYEIMAQVETRAIRVRQPEQEVNSSLNTVQAAEGNTQWTAGFSYDALGNLITTTGRAESSKRKLNKTARQSASISTTAKADESKRKPIRAEQSRKQPFLFIQTVN